VRVEIHSTFWRSSHIVPAHLPDEYFIPTSTDLKAAQATLSARTQALTNAPLQLRAVREAESKAKRDRWPEVLNIRPMV
jgi:tether containing UBX domain for GLUT4